MRVRFPLRLKIGAFAALLVALACAALWWLAAYRPALAERARREEQYSQLALMLGASGALNAQSLTNPAMHPDLAYALRARAGQVLADGSVVHRERFEPLMPSLAADPAAAYAALYPLRTGAVAGLVVKRVTLRSERGEEELLLGFSTRALDAELRRKLLDSLLVLAVALAVAVLGAGVLGAQVSRPVGRLAAALEQVGRGNLQPVAVSSSDEVGLLARSFNEMVRALKERERLRGTLARYVSDDVAARILAEKSDLDLPGEQRQVTVLFLDIRGFSALSERLTPRELVAMLNEYFAVIVEVIFKHHGTLNKFIGDAVMAIYGAPQSIDEPEMRAVRTAVEIAQQLATLSRQRQAEGRPVFSVGIGINSGQAVAGNIGSERRMEYTVIGDEVNLAQRLEAGAREGEILISQSTFDKVKERVDARPREPMTVKGKSMPVQVYEVVGLSG